MLDSSVYVFIYIHLRSVYVIFNIYSCPLVWQCLALGFEAVDSVPRFERQIFYASITVLNGLFLVCISGLQDGSKPMKMSNVGRTMP